MCYMSPMTYFDGTQNIGTGNTASPRIRIRSVLKHGVHLDKMFQYKIGGGMYCSVERQISSVALRSVPKLMLDGSSVPSLSTDSYFSSQCKKIQDNIGSKNHARKVSVNLPCVGCFSALAPISLATWRCHRCDPRNYISNHEKFHLVTLIT